MKEKQFFKFKFEGENLRKKIFKFSLLLDM